MKMCALMQHTLFYKKQKKSFFSSIRKRVMKVYKRTEIRQAFYTIFENIPILQEKMCQKPKIIMLPQAIQPLEQFKKNSGGALVGEESYFEENLRTRRSQKLHLLLALKKCFRHEKKMRLYEHFCIYSADLVLQKKQKNVPSAQSGRA